MGLYLSTPNTEKESGEGVGSRVIYGFSSMQGWRTGMEDAHVAMPDIDANTSLFAVFDGHGGKEVAAFSAKYIKKVLQSSKHYAEGDHQQALISSFLTLDDKMRTKSGKRELISFKKSKGSDEGLTPKLIQQVVQQIAKDEGLKMKVEMDEAERKRKEEEEKEEEERELAKAKRKQEQKEAEEAKKAKTCQSEEEEGGEESATGNKESKAETNDSEKNKEEGKEDDEEEDDDDDDDEEDDGAPVSSAGATAVVGILNGNKFIVANAGDSRCIASRSGSAVALTNDHKPDLPDERARIIGAGGTVQGGRVCGNLNLSRALGDMEFKKPKDFPPEKQMISAYPEVTTYELEEGDEFLVLACDGVWDVMTNQQVVDYVKQRIPEGTEPTPQLAKEICEQILDECLAPDTRPPGLGTDNMTIVLVFLKK